MLTEILTQLLRTPPFFGNFSANWEQTISLSCLGPVIYQNDFEGLGGENRLDALNERSDRATAVVDGNH